MRQILFYAQNNGQALNVKLMLDELKNNGYLVVIYNTSEIYYQSIDYYGFNLIEECSFSLNQSFYRSSLLERIKSVRKASKSLKSVVWKYDMLLVAADGAFERILINEFIKQGKKTIMLTDGIISDYNYSICDLIRHPTLIKTTFISNIKRMLFNIFKTTSISPFLPSQVGLMPLDKILVMGEHSKECIEKINHHSMVIASGMPRLYNQIIERKSSNEEPYYVCYFPSAFKWHHLDNNDKKQHADIENVCNAISVIRKKEGINIHLVIKMHPRESIEDYKHYTDIYNFVSIEEKVSIVECFERYHLFLSNVSTVIIEGLINSIRVYSLMMNFEYWRYKKSFLASNEIMKIYSREELYDIIKTCAMGNDCVSIPSSEKCLLFERNCSPSDVVGKIIC